MIIAGPECLNVLLEHPRLRGIARIRWELHQYCVDAFRIVDQQVPESGVLLLEFVEEFLHQLGIQFHPGRGFPEERCELRVVLVTGFPAVVGPVADEQFV